MSLVNRIIVSGRLDSGDTVDVSLKVVGRPYNEGDLAKLCEKIAKQLVPCEQDILYYQVRTWSGNGGNKRKNWAKLPTMDALSQVVSEVMKREEVPT